MLPKTTQATSTEVEGNTTVEVHGNDASGTPLEELQNADEPENQTADSPTEEVVNEPVAEKPVEQGSETKLTEKAPRSERRTEKLIDVLKARTDEVSELRKQLDAYRGTAPVNEQPQLPPWLNSPVPEGEVTLEDYKAQVADAARNLVKSELSEFQKNVLKYEGFKEDLAKVESKYPILNQDDEAFDKEKAKTVAELYDKASKTDPSLRLADFVEKIMSFHQAGQEIGKSEIKASVIKRDAEAAVSPNPVTGNLPGSGPDWESMTLAEKETWMKEQGIWDQ